MYKGKRGATKILLRILIRKLLVRALAKVRIGIPTTLFSVPVSNPIPTQPYTPQSNLMHTQVHARLNTRASCTTHQALASFVSPLVNAVWNGVTVYNSMIECKYLVLGPSFVDCMLAAILGELDLENMTLEHKKQLLRTVGTTVVDRKRSISFSRPMEHRYPQSLPAVDPPAQK